MVSGSIVGMEGSTSLRRVGSMRRTFMSGTAGLKKRSMCLQVKFQVDSIIETIPKFCKKYGEINLHTEIIIPRI
jgi:myosin-18